MGVSSTEKKNTKEDLARAMTKSKARCKQSLMDKSVEKVMNHIVGECSNIRDLIE